MASFHVFCAFCACFIVLHPYMCLYGCCLNYRSELLYPLFCYQDHLYSFFWFGVHSMNYFFGRNQESNLAKIPAMMIIYFFLLFYGLGLQDQSPGHLQFMFHYSPGPPVIIVIFIQFEKAKHFFLIQYQQQSWELNPWMNVLLQLVVCFWWYINVLVVILKS